MALHKTVQRSLPVTLVGAGLPQLPRLAGDAKSYAERLFKFPHIGRLISSTKPRKRSPARPPTLAWTSAPRRSWRSWSTPRAIRTSCRNYGKIVWNLAPEGAEIALDSAEAARPLVEATLDESFFRVRTQRITELELQYLRVMAELGHGPFRTGDVAEANAVSSSSGRPARA